MVNEFDYRNKRIMLSLGPLSKIKYCTFSCPFCYVHGNFSKYPNLSVREISDWVSNIKGEYDIIYVSGDTDSFASPRTEKGIELLSELTKFKVDLLFTTRFVFDKIHLSGLSDVLEKQKSAGKLLIGCTSVAQLNHTFLEPRPIESPLSRINQLASFKQLGLASVVSICPIFPFVDSQEYIEIINHCKGKVDLILASDWYTDTEGIIEGKILKNIATIGIPDGKKKMDFNINENDWNVYESKSTKKIMEDHCNNLHIPFFQRSRPALDWLREQNPNLKIVNKQL